jgi:hypothetical protein
LSGISNFQYRKAAPLRGLRPDFTIATAQRPIILEVKRSLRGSVEVRRAAEVARRFKEATGAKAALVVGPKAAREFGEGMVVTLSELVSKLHELRAVQRVRRAAGASRNLNAPPALAGRTGRYALASAHVTQALDSGPILHSFGRREPAGRRTDAGSPSQVFVAMPFTSEFDDVFFVAARRAALRLHLYAKRIDRPYFSGEVVPRIRAELNESKAVIADVSGANPNVLYEVGFAHALGKPMVQICRTPLADLPFDVRAWNTISYEAGRTDALRRVLYTALTAILG